MGVEISKVLYSQTTMRQKVYWFRLQTEYLSLISSTRDYLLLPVHWQAIHHLVRCYPFDFKVCSLPSREKQPFLILKIISTGKWFRSLDWKDEMGSCADEWVVYGFLGAPDVKDNFSCSTPSYHLHSLIGFYMILAGYCFFSSGRKRM